MKKYWYLIVALFILLFGTTESNAGAVPIVVTAHTTNSSVYGSSNAVVADGYIICSHPEETKCRVISTVLFEDDTVYPSFEQFLHSKYPNASIVSIQHVYYGSGSSGLVIYFKFNKERK